MGKMRHCLIISALLLAGCGRNLPPPVVPADLLEPVPGYQGKTPKTQGQLISAIIADKRALGQCNLQVESIREILQGN